MSTRFRTALLVLLSVALCVAVVSIVFNLISGNSRIENKIIVMKQEQGSESAGFLIAFNGESNNDISSVVRWDELARSHNGMVLTNDNMRRKLIPTIEESEIIVSNRLRFVIEISNDNTIYRVVLNEFVDDKLRRKFLYKIDDGFVKPIAITVFRSGEVRDF